ncbi:E3 ubiquitin ligase BIG BROTHER [Dendrobium catenatum]|uniref:RING-type E3 ubiquitin transferase n=1 Tax=Dendrobium catenatum TaxID=906689 RepID=A0A2I0W0A0_9ASPA|nr:E3 ubiquitin ligase BIG BROTHER [Dendrobium catenatum]
MPNSDGPLSSPDRRGFRTLLRLRNPPTPSADQNPLLISSSPRLPNKKKAFASAALRSLSCSSSAASQAYAPSSAAAAVRSSADWDGKGSRRRRTNKKKKDRSSAAADVWCTPGISFAGDDSVDCVVSQSEMVGRGGRVEVERALRERTYYGRRVGNREAISSTADSKSSPRALLFEADLTPSEHFLRMREYYHQPPVELEEVAIPHPSELLELGDKIGHVSTGLREEEIECNIRKAKLSIFDKLLSTEMERKCSICQEEYETDDEVGKLGCGHSYHIYCIRKWLLQKNACPVCKTALLSLKLSIESILLIGCVFPKAMQPVSAGVNERLLHAASELSGDEFGLATSPG